MMNSDLKKKMKKSRPSITVIGLGGAGCNIMTYLSENNIVGVKTIAANSEISHLVIAHADKLLLLGKGISRGKGCGGFPEIGAQCARESSEEIRKELKGSSIVFIVAGLGGGTGTGSAPVVAEISRSMGALTIACLTMPFEIESLRRENAKKAIKYLSEICDSVVLLDNTKLRKVAGNLPLKTAFEVANSLIAEFIKGITESITIPSLVNLDLADLKTVLENRGVSSFGIGEAEGIDRVNKAVLKATVAPLLDIHDISSASGLFIHINGGQDLTLDEVAHVGELMAKQVPGPKKIIWGANVEESMTGRIMVLALFAGVGNPFE